MQRETEIFQGRARAGDQTFADNKTRFEISVKFCICPQWSCLFKWLGNYSKSFACLTNSPPHEWLGPESFLLMILLLFLGHCGVESGIVHGFAHDIIGINETLHRLVQEALDTSCHIPVLLFVMMVRRRVMRSLMTLDRLDKDFASIATLKFKRYFKNHWEKA